MLQLFRNYSNILSGIRSSLFSLAYCSVSYKLPQGLSGIINVTTLEMQGHMPFSAVFVSSTNFNENASHYTTGQLNLNSGTSTHM